MSAAYLRELEQARLRKERYRGTCRECGARTTGSLGPGKAPSLCFRCSAKRVALERRGKGPVNSRVLAYLSEPRRFTEVRAHLDTSGAYAGQVLRRLMSYGLVTRLRRGVYVATKESDG